MIESPAKAGPVCAPSPGLPGAAEGVEDMVTASPGWFGTRVVDWTPEAGKGFRAHDIQGLVSSNTHLDACAALKPTQRL